MTSSDGQDKSNRVCYDCRRAMAVVATPDGWLWWTCLACDRAPLKEVH